MLTVYVPYEAKITINGLPTQSTGSRRQYASFGLKPGMNYKYDIHAEIVRDGKIVEESKTVTLTAGQQDAAAFGFNKPTEGMATFKLRGYRAVQETPVSGLPARGLFFGGAVAISRPRRHNLGLARRRSGGRET